MKTTMLNYEEVKGLLLQGFEVKLPEWEGYWKMNEKKNGIEVHTKDGEILDTPDIMYTFHSNWEIATVDNCSILKKEKSKNTKKTGMGFEVIDMDIIKVPLIGAMPVVIIKKDGETEPTILKTSEFEELVGGRVEAMEMLKEFTLSSVPKEARELFSFIDNKLSEIVALASEIDEEDEKKCDCPICSEEITEETIEMIGNMLSEITGGAIRVKNLNK